MATIASLFFKRGIRAEKSGLRSATAVVAGLASANKGFFGCIAVVVSIFSCLTSSLISGVVAAGFFLAIRGSLAVDGSVELESKDELEEDLTGECGRFWPWGGDPDVLVLLRAGEPVDLAVESILPF